MILWHNPRCSKSRQALALLQEAGHSPSIRLYLKEPPTRNEVAALHRALGIPAADMIRKGEKLYKDLGLKDAADDALLDAIADAPILLERPILQIEDGAIIGRPPENVLKLATKG